MTKAERTKQFIIEKTAPFFNTKGYAATSLSDITELTGLTKGSIYGNFSGKEEVVIEAFKYNAQELRNKMDIAISEAEGAYNKLLAFVDFYKSSWSGIIVKGGCPMLNAATEADDHLLFLKETVKQNFIAWQKRLEGLIDEGRKEGQFRKNIDTAQYASTFIMLIEGGILLSRSLGRPDALNTALDRMLRIIDQEIVL